MYRRAQAEGTILILAPLGRDAQLMADTLSAGGLAPVICPKPETLVPMMQEGAAAAIVAEEALVPPILSRIEEWLAAQPSWSDFPFIILALGGRPSPATSQKAHELEILGNVTLLERPVRPDTILSSARAALRARLRQYATRHHQQALTQANADLEQFAHSASHDLREPIRMISIYSQLMSQRYGHLLDEQGTNFLQYLITGATRMETLIKDLLAYAEASGIADAVHEPIDATDAFEAALSNLREAIRESGASIHHGDLRPVRMREVHLQQLFQNLIGNAIKYRGHAPPVITVESGKDNGYSTFLVRDNGIGISPGYQEQIFGIFKRLHTDAKYQGTGMGLAICRRIVERYRGTIWVESEFGKGSTFKFRVPS